MANRYKKSGKSRLVRSSFMILRDHDETLDRLEVEGFKRSAVVRLALDAYFSKEGLQNPLKGAV